VTKRPRERTGLTPEAAGSRRGSRRKTQRRQARQCEAASKPLIGWRFPYEGDGNGRFLGLASPAEFASIGPN